MVGIWRLCLIHSYWEAVLTPSGGEGSHPALLFTTVFVPLAPKDWEKHNGSGIAGNRNWFGDAVGFVEPFRYYCRVPSTKYCKMLNFLICVM